MTVEMCDKLVSTQYDDIETLIEMGYEEERCVSDPGNPGECWMSSSGTFDEHAYQYPAVRRI